MKTNKKLFAGILLASGLILSGESNAITGNSTPGQYSVNLQSVSFHPVGASSSTYVTYRSGSSNVNIAASQPGQPCVGLGPSASLPTGSYDQFRVIVSNVMTISGSSTGNLSNGLPCRTVANGAVVNDPFGDGSVSQAYLGSTDGGTPQTETVTVPTGTAVTLPSGFSVVGNSIQAIFPVNVTVKDKVPQGTVTFNVANGILFQAYGPTQCVVLPTPPSIQVSLR